MFRAKWPRTAGHFPLRSGTQDNNMLQLVPTHLSVAQPTRRTVEALWKGWYALVQVPFFQRFLQMTFPI